MRLNVISIKCYNILLYLNISHERLVFKYQIKFLAGKFTLLVEM